jgi:hypothetical protein
MRGDFAPQQGSHFQLQQNSQSASFHGLEACNFLAAAVTTVGFCNIIIYSFTFKGIEQCML